MPRVRVQGPAPTEEELRESELRNTLKKVDGAAGIVAAFAALGAVGWLFGAFLAFLFFLILGAFGGSP